MSTRDYEFTVRRDSTISEGRERTLRRMRIILGNFSTGVPDKVNCFLHGLTLGLAVGHVIGHADADEVDDLLPPKPAGEVIEAIPY